MARGAAVFTLLAVAFCATVSASATADQAVVISGVGAAHGFGLAMDGVEGQARAGWTHDKILSLFYPGTATGQAGGTIRVGLHDGPSATLSLPTGGSFSQAPRGAGPATALPPGANVKLSARGGAIVVDAGVPEPSAQEPAAATAQQQEPPPQAPTLVPTPPPLLEPTPAPAKKREPAKPGGAQAPAAGTLRSVWLWGAGDPGLVALDATGRRYRGTMEVRPKGDALVVVNHVDLETYVAGIAEEKGQGWPAEGMKVLAIAARTLGAATMSWYDKNQANGYDICPTASCQLYLGYDGEAPDMWEATRSTAGQIRTHNGRPILAMYHGNGGGQTESYSRVIDNGTDPHPYLSAVRYPFAAPSRWREKRTLDQITTSLRAAGVGVPARIDKIEVLERGVSPRVLRVRITGDGTKSEVSGVQFADALELRSTWFDLGGDKAGSAFVTSDVLAADAVQRADAAPASATRGWGAAAVTALLSVALLLLAGRLRRSSGLPS